MMQKEQERWLSSEILPDLLSPKRIKSRTFSFRQSKGNQEKCLADSASCIK
ncbi:hypothetical protein HFN_1560 [Helicobacter fennelliae MRY12-0050]|uniref:Uncharacterized protein n=1 Tax=Helicobacter fennelliae MRY12-0050 TaxID=1325130 RepID=T1CYI2_9HELI|nr:hypothetical protein HFN_1560 [Helicobacter fennelliae MRY12-0050]